MANVLDLRRRIRSVQNTRQITGAMKMVSAAKLRRAQEHALAARPYAQMLTSILKSLVSRVEIFDPVTGEPRHPLLLRREERNILLIVVSGDKGFAGAFNANVIKAATRFMETKQGKKIEIEVIGRKGRDFFRRRYPASSQENAPISVSGEHIGILAKLEFSRALEIAQNVVDRYRRGEIDSVYLVYNEFKSVIAQRLVVDEILPIAQIGAPDIKHFVELTQEEREHVAHAASTAGVSVRATDTTEMDAHAAQIAKNTDYIYEQPAGEIFRGLLPRYVAIVIYRSLLESAAAEHAARMTAMDSATNNASEMIDSLTLTMNRVRQAAITKEIIEIVSGAAAL